MRGRYLLETAQWEAIAQDGTDSHGGHDAMPGMPLAQAGAGAWRFYAGVSAAKRGESESVMVPNGPTGSRSGQPVR